MSSPIPPEVAAEIEELLFAGRKINAIKLYREYRGLGLKESKDFIEALESELRIREPDKFTAPPAGQRRRLGILVLLLVLSGIVGVAVVFGLVGVAERPQDAKPAVDRSVAEREAAVPGPAADPQPASDRVEVTTVEQPQPLDLAGTWRIRRPPKMDRLAKLTRIDGSHYRLTPESLAFSGVYAWDGKTLSMESGNSGYPDLTWSLNDQGQFTMIKGAYKNATMSREK